MGVGGWCRSGFVLIHTISRGKDPKYNFVTILTIKLKT
jgi:hypothetical protein